MLSPDISPLKYCYTEVCKKKFEPFSKTSVSFYPVVHLSSQFEKLNYAFLLTH
jgi:hypothetical protein